MDADTTAIWKEKKKKKNEDENYNKKTPARTSLGSTRSVSPIDKPGSG